MFYLRWHPIPWAPDRQCLSQQLQGNEGWFVVHFTCLLCECSIRTRTILYPFRAAVTTLLYWWGCFPRFAATWPLEGFIDIWATQCECVEPCCRGVSICWPPLHTVCTLLSLQSGFRFLYAQEGKRYTADRKSAVNRKRSQTRSRKFSGECFNLDEAESERL